MALLLAVILRELDALKNAEEVSPGFAMVFLGVFLPLTIAASAFVLVVEFLVLWIWLNPIKPQSDSDAIQQAASKRATATKPSAPTLHGPRPSLSARSHRIAVR